MLLRAKLCTQRALERASRCQSLLASVLSILALAVFGASSAKAQQVVISQIYGGGGNVGATYNRDYVELHNRGSSAVNLSTWSIQYGASTGTTWQRLNLTGSIAACGYYLIQMTTSGTVGIAIPAPDVAAITAIDMAATAGKVALVNNQTTLAAQACFDQGTSGVEDFVGYGQSALPAVTGPNCYEGSGGTQPVLSATLATFRNNSGCTDTQDNALDFTNGAPAPRNSASPTFCCTPTGACCSGTTCTYTDAGSCGGSYQGDFSRCGTVTYPTPTTPGNAFEDISGTGTLITALDNSDDGSAAFSFTPAFNYHGKNRNIVSVGVNGIISFLPGTAATSFSNVAIPAVGTPNDIICPLWMDMFNRTTQTGGHIYIQALGSPNRLVMQWKDVSTRTSSTVTPDKMNFEVVLFLDGSGTFDIRYGTMTTTATTPAYTATTGCENQPGTAGTPYAGVSYAALAGTDRHFTPTGASACSPPANDNCASATTIGTGGTGPGGVGGTNALATLDGPALGCGTAVDKDVWFSFQPAASLCPKTWDISDCSGTGFDTVIEVYDACGGTLLFCNDDDATCGSGVQSRLTGVTLSSATAYKIRLASKGSPGAGGAYNLVVVPTPPGNDVCGVNQSLFTIPGTGGSVCADLTAANSEGNAASSTMSGTGQRDLFYYFTPTDPCATGWTFSTCGGPDVDTNLSIHTACLTPSLNNQLGTDSVDQGCASGNLSSATWTNLVTGTPYIIRCAMWSSSATPGAVTMTVTSVGGAGNDMCAAPISLALPANTGGSTACATPDGTSSCDSVGKDVWYKFTTTSAGPIHIDTCGSSIDTVITLYTGTCGSLTEIACNDDGTGCPCGAPASVLDGNLPADTYTLRLSDKGLGGGPFALKVVIPTILNDDCCSAIPVACGSATAGTTVGANIDAVPATFGPGVADFGGNNTVGATPGVWYSVLGTGGTIYADTLTANFDTKLAVFSGSCGGLTPVTMNDDVQSSPFHSKVAFATSAGTQYLILVHGFSGSGTFTLNVTCDATPSNDDCSSAAAIGGPSGSIGGTNVGASGAPSSDPSGSSLSTNLAACATAGSYWDTWYSWTAPCTSSVTFATCGALDTIVSVHSTCQTLTAGNMIAGACNDNGSGACAPGSSVTLSVTGGTTYLIRVATAGALVANPGGGGAYTLTWSMLDTDGDLVADCFDGCPTDPGKTAPGVCGCGFSDVDSDGDTFADCVDGCPFDPLKQAAGICGCGVSDVDTDGDTFADCIDGCPLDPLKQAAGVCGCGVSDVDSDGDTFPDCVDGCPADPLKQAAGACGCGVADVDTDGDTFADCIDGCPTDPAKQAPGQCGCGSPDTDTDGDSVADCVDGCPLDGLKTAPGQCGCGVSDVDTDSDGVADCTDNCDTIANPSQDDCDLDGIGDVCEIANNMASDIDANGVPDSCQPGAILVYCSSGTSVNGCVPTIGTFGTPSASQPNGFYVATFGNDGQRFGQFFYSITGVMQAPFNAGYMCVQGPRQRMGTPFLTGGVAGACNGALFIDINVYATLNPTSIGIPLQAGGISYYFQGYNRDPASPGGLVMTNAVGVTFLP